ncbi:MAG TPA: hypothetical protein VGR47_19075 [Terracidiphilus sp.]|nr:hypothetical protein [Terracidiphilus sp.]
MVWLSDLFAAIARREGPVADRSNKARTQARRYDRTAKQIEAALGGAPVRIEDLVDIDTKLVDYFKSLREPPGVSATLAHLKTKEHMLQEAHREGWTCTRYELLQSWRPLYDARRGRHMSFSTIAEDAIAAGIFAKDYCDEHLVEWRYSKTNPQNLIPYPAPAADQAISHLRALIRNCGLQTYFPKLDVSLRRRANYVLPWKAMPRTLVEQIQGMYPWAVEEAPADIRKSSSSGEAIVNILRELSSHAISQPDGLNIDSLRQVITLERVNDGVDYRLDERQNLPGSVIVNLRWLCALVKQHDLFKGGEYDWLILKVNSIIHEPRWVRRERKRRKLVPPQELHDLPAKIRADRLARSGLTPEQVARSMHNELFFSMPPWRSENHCDVDLKINVIESVMTDDLWHKLTYIPDWVRDNKDENRTFIFIHFFEDKMKARKQIWEVMDQKNEDLYRDFVTNHRKHLVNKRHPHSSLFVGGQGLAMTKLGLRRLMAEVSERYLDKRMSHHLRRDCVAIGMIVAGAAYDLVGAVLQHSGDDSTDEYLRGLPSIGCAEVMEQEAMELAVELGLDFT